MPSASGSVGKVFAIHAALDTPRYTLTGTREAQFWNGVTRADRPTSFWPCPNGYVDDGLVPLLTGDELKCLLVIGRTILGWEEKRGARRDHISLSQLVHFTGLARPRVTRATAVLCRANLIAKREARPGRNSRGTLWEINLGQLGPIDRAYLKHRNAHQVSRNASRVRAAALASAQGRTLPASPTRSANGTVGVPLRQRANGTMDVPFHQSTNGTVDVPFADSNSTLDVPFHQSTNGTVDVPTKERNKEEEEDINWDTLLARLRCQLPRATFNAYLHRTTATIANRTVTIHALNALDAEWIDRRLRPLIERTLAAAFDSPHTLQVTT